MALFDPSQIRSVRISQVESSNRTLTAVDAQKHLYNSAATTYTLTVPASIFATDDEVELACPGTGSFNITPGSGLTMNGSTATKTIAAGKGGYMKFYSPTVCWLYGGS